MKVPRLPHFAVDLWRCAVVVLKMTKNGTAGEPEDGSRNAPAAAASGCYITLAMLQNIPLTR